MISEETKIEIQVNGEPQFVQPELTVTDIVAQWELVPERLAIELNLKILPRSAWAETKLQSGDRLEVVHFVGGG